MLKYIPLEKHDEFTQIIHFCGILPFLIQNLNERASPILLKTTGLTKEIDFAYECGQLWGYFAQKKYEEIVLHLGIKAENIQALTFELKSVIESQKHLLEKINDYYKKLKAIRDHKELEKHGNKRIQLRIPYYFNKFYEIREYLKESVLRLEKQVKLNIYLYKRYESLGNKMDMLKASNESDENQEIDLQQLKLEHIMTVGNYLTSINFIKSPESYYSRSINLFRKAAIIQQNTLPQVLQALSKKNPRSDSRHFKKQVDHAKQTVTPQTRVFLEGYFDAVDFTPQNKI